jgi:opacity protein-like surface antigen
MKKLLLAALFFISADILLAQNISITPWGAISLPIGGFSGTTMANVTQDQIKDGMTMSQDGYAKLFFGFGADFDYKLPSMPKLKLMFSTGFILNKVPVAFYSDIEKAWYKALGGNLTATPTGSDGSLGNIPILAGAKYEEKLNPNVSFYGFGGVGLNMCMYPDAEITWPDNTKDKFTSSSAMSFAFAIGAGVNFMKYIDVSIRYYNGTKAKINWTFTSPDPNLSVIKKFTTEVPVSMILFTVGYRWGL